MPDIFSSWELQELLSKVLSIRSALPRLYQTTFEEFDRILCSVREEQYSLVQEWIQNNALMIRSLSWEDIQVLFCLRDDRGIFIIGDPQRGWKPYFSAFTSSSEYQ